jgi:hypothetical protein
MHALEKKTQMRIELQSGRMRLDPGQLLKLRDAAGSTVCALEGAVWITEENHPHDIVLGPNGCHRLSRSGLAIIQSLGGAASLTLS